MSVYKPDSGHNVVYVEHSTSAIGASLYQSSADPTNLASIMRNARIIVRSVPIPMPTTQRMAGLHPGTIWTSEDFDEPLPDEFWVGNA